MLKVCPLERPNINDIVNQLQEIAVARGVNPKSALDINISQLGQPSAPAEEEDHCKPFLLVTFSQSVRSERNVFF